MLRLVLPGFLVLSGGAGALAQEARRVEALPAAEIVALAAGTDRLYAATFSRVYTSLDGGESWEAAASLPVDAQDHGVYALLAHETNLFAGTLGSGVFVSSDGGASWSSPGSGLTGLARRVLSLAVRGDSLYAGTDAGVYVLNLQQPAVWQDFSQGLGASSVRTLATSGRALVAGAGGSGQVWVRSSGAGTWTSIPLGPQPHAIAYTLLPSGSFLLAGTSDGIYRSSLRGDGWVHLQGAFPQGADVLALAACGARLYAGVQHQGYALYSSDDHGATWVLRNQIPASLLTLLGRPDRLWVGRGDGLWYYDLSSTTPLFQASFVEEEQGQPVLKGGASATLSGHALHLVVFFSALRHPWARIDLYEGIPEQGGTLIQNLALAVPAPAAHSGGVEATVALTEAQIQALHAGRFYLHLSTIEPSVRLGGPVQVLPVVAPVLAGTELSERWQGLLLARGSMLATLEKDRLRLAGFFSGLRAPWSQVDLYRGVPGLPGEHVKNLLLNFSGDPGTDMGFNRTLTLTEGQVQDLLDGLLYLAVQTLRPDGEVRGQLLSHPNRAPGTSRILTPPGGNTILIGGTEAGDPVDPDTPLATISLAPADDPDGHRVVYLWQASRDPAFGPSTTTTVELGVDSLNLPLTVAGLAAVFEAAWSGHTPPLHTPVAFYHRAVTSDGARFSYGEAVTLTLVRGTITADEPLADLPRRFVLHGNYPNPFYPATTVVFDLPAAAEVTVEVFNLLGQRVLTVPAGLLAAGPSHRVQVDAAALPSGSYLYRLVMQRGDTVQVARGKMSLVR
ncbi:T9SS type A sorting domain-containing protein [Rhodocaloribacter litoris]|uniref:CHRD domain-containing protein n=1 Tax=Rhodocaloribacter litoris TaxID=2558931 RepID=UPI00141DB399|nr:CHRD domain-containing protein [Rhodocaloribacter litoris]QXD15538.1 T9SS type A sorting domain-containing protein [Rhodocaloribacter litoris]